MKQMLILLGVAASFILVACPEPDPGPTTSNTGGAGGDGMGGAGGDGMGGMGGDGMGGMGGDGMGGMGGMGGVGGGMGGAGGAPTCLKCSKVKPSGPMNACPGQSAMLLMALQKCSCVDKCTSECGDNVCMNMNPSGPCSDCIATECNTEYQACLADN
jgi:hypothetical protein